MDYNNEPPKITFEDEQFQRPRSFQSTTPKIVGFVIKYSGGYIKDERQANYVLIGFAVVAIIVSLFLFFGADSIFKNKTGIDQMMQLHPDLFRGNTSL